MTGPVMLDLEGLELSAEEREIIQHPLVGGIILFTRNFDSLEQLRQLTQAIRTIKPNLLIAVDHEGGRVQRFRQGFTHLPPMRTLGQRFEVDPKLACDSAQTIGWLMAAELLAFGIDLSFAPVLDLDHGCSTVIGDRSFHSQAETVSLLAQALIKGMHQAGMAAVGKHFPGHGAVIADSHIAIPIDERSLSDIKQQDLKPFAQLAKTGLDGVMPAHVIYSQVDQYPAGFSAVWLQQILRGELAFEGAIFSDDLVMQGASVIGDYIERAKQALAVGCDMILVCNDRKAAIQILDNVKYKLSPESQQRLQRMLGKAQYQEFKPLQKSMEWQQAVSKIESL